MIASPIKMIGPPPQQASPKPVAKRSTTAAPSPKRAPSARELYRAECSAIAEGDPRWERGECPTECSRCDAFTSWVAPDAKPACPGCWDWLGDADAETLPTREPPKADPRLPAGTKHPACSRCPAGGPRPSYDWAWSTRKRARKRVLQASCARCHRPCGEVDPGVFAGFAPPVPPGEPPTSDLFCLDYEDPDDEVGHDALDVQSDRDKKASRVRTGKDFLALRVPTVLLHCASCWHEARAVLYPWNFRDGRPTCTSCLLLSALEERAPDGMVWAHARGTREAVRALPEEVGWSYEGDFPYEPMGYGGLRWSDFKSVREAHRERLSRGKQDGAGTYSDARDAVSGAPMSDKDVRAYLDAVREEKISDGTIEKLASGTITEVKRRKRQ